MPLGVPEEGIPAPASQALGIQRGRLEDLWEGPWNHPAGPREAAGPSEEDDDVTNVYHDMEIPDDFEEE